MNLIEKATIIHYHRQRIAEYDPGTAKALGWRNENNQQIRFDILARIGPIHHRSVLDIGCGHGDLKAYLDKIDREYDYIGIDQMPEFIAHARERYAGANNAVFFKSDFSQEALPEVDYVFASGALGYRCHSPEFYLNMIRKFYAASRLGLAFNMLDAEYFPAHPLLVGHNRADILEFCRSLTSHVELVTGYLGDDFSVLLHRNAPN